MFPLLPVSLVMPEATLTLLQKEDQECFPKGPPLNLPNGAFVSTPFILAMLTHRWCKIWKAGLLHSKQSIHALIYKQDILLHEYLLTDPAKGFRAKAKIGSQHVLRK